MTPISRLSEGKIVRIDGYKATTVKRWDKTPTALVLHSSKTHHLCFNINWLDRKDKRKLLAFLEEYLKGSTLERNASRKKFFRRLARKSFPRSCYRLYLTSNLPNKLYELTTEEFIQAIKGDELTITGVKTPRKSANDQKRKNKKRRKNRIKKRK